MVGKNYPLVFFAALLILAACTPGASSSTYSGQPTPTFADSISKPELAPEGSQQPDSTCVPSDTKTCSIHYVLSDLYDDEHVMRTSPYFERAGYTLQVASDTLDVIHGFHECCGHTPANPDMLLDDVDVTNYDAIFFCRWRSLLCCIPQQPGRSPYRSRGFGTGSGCGGNREWTGDPGTCRCIGWENRDCTARLRMGWAYG
jgi:hypothetical protein